MKDKEPLSVTNAMLRISRDLYGASRDPSNSTSRRVSCDIKSHAVASATMFVFPIESVLDLSLRLSAAIAGKVNKPTNLR